MSIPDCLKDGGTAPAVRETIDVDLSIDTPCFLGGAEQGALSIDLLRIPSLRGLLRWWWRADQAERDHETLLKNERCIWGGAAQHDERLPRSIVLYKRSPETIPTTFKADTKRGSAAYYLSYALGGTQQEPTPRTGYAVGNTASIRAQFDSNAQKKAFDRSLQLLTTFGGVGSRNRRSWGSLSLIDNCPSSWQDQQQRMQTILESSPARSVDGAGIQRSLLGKHARCETARCTFSHQELLETVHAFFKGSDKLHKESWCFGLPHTKGKDAVLDGPAWVDRRASPIMVKATRLPEGRYALSALLLDGAFLDFSGHSHDEREYSRLQPRLHSFMDKVASCTGPEKAARPRAR